VSQLPWEEGEEEVSGEGKGKRIRLTGEQRPVAVTTNCKQLLSIGNKPRRRDLRAATSCSAKGEGKIGGGTG